MRTTPLALLPLAVAAALALSGCGGSTANKTTTAESSTAASTSAAPRCPAAWLAGWRRLARRIDAPVYCPTWLPQPLDGKIGGEYAKGPYYGPHGSYLVPMVWFEMMPDSPYEVHVNLRGYPGETAIPTCEDTLVTKGKVIRPKIPCFADARGPVRIGDTSVTVYTANQGADTWHVLYAWHHGGSLYTLSQHIAPPFTYAQVVRSLNRMLRGLAIVRP